jgi:regulatory factor X 1/2/3
MLGTVQQLDQQQVADVEECWRNFWQPEIEDGDDPEVSDENRSIGSQLATTHMNELSQAQLFSLCTLPHIQTYIREMDMRFYQVLVDVLCPNVLRHMPSTLTQTIRAFAKRLESGLSVALQGAPHEIIKIKVWDLMSYRSSDL